MTVLRAGSATDIGLVRATNQDQLLVGASLFAVADGMGGHAAGEVASATAVAALEEAWDKAGTHDRDALVGAARDANRKVWEAAQADSKLHGMGTTLVAVALVGEPPAEELAVVNVGDSRVYLLRRGELEQLTIDHSLVAELVAEGQLAADEAEFHPQRHVLTRALGVDSDVPVDALTVEPFRGDRLLLCSDGLIREVDDSQVASVLRRLHDPAEAAKELVAEARMRGGSDNITVVIVDVVDDDDKAGRASAALGADTGLVIPHGIGENDGDPTAALRAERGEVVSPEALKPSRRERRRLAREATASDGRPQARLITVRVVGFVLLLIIVLAGAAAFIGWYARGGYFVGVDNGQLAIYQGRPGGVLWFGPTLAATTGVPTGKVEPRHLPDLQAGVTEPTMSAARAYVANLAGEYSAAQKAAGATAPTTVPPPATAPPTTAKAP